MSYDAFLFRLIDELSMCLFARSQSLGVHCLRNYFQLIASVEVIAMRCLVHRTAINLKLISESRTCIKASLPPSVVLSLDDDTNRRNRAPKLCCFLQSLSRQHIKVHIVRLDRNANKTNKSETFGPRTPKETARKAFIHMIT